MTQINQKSLLQIEFNFNPNTDSFEYKQYSVQEIGFNNEWEILKYGTDKFQEVKSIEEIVEFIKNN